MALKTLRIIQHQTTYMAPAASEEELEGFEDEEELEEEEEESEDEEEDEESEEEEEDEDSDEEDEEESEDEEDEEESEDEDEEDLENLGKRSQKRIKGLLKDNKRLKEELEEAKKLGGDDGEAIMSVAKRVGIIPRLMTKTLAEKIEKYESKKSALEYMQSLLDDDEQDEFEIGNKTYSRKEVRQRVRTLKEEVEELKDDAKSGKAKAIDETKKLIELGLAAQKAGWKPGKKSEKKTKETKGPKKHKTHATPGNKRKTSGKVDFSRVDSSDDLEEMIARQMRGGK